jgi:hypothetical protein
MSGNPVAAPTLVLMGSVLPEYGKFRFDRTLAAARRDIGPDPDFARRDHVVRLRIWLNQWICRIGYPRPGEDDLLADSLATWWTEYKVMLPPADQRLAQLEDAQLKSLSSAYAGLYALPAAAQPGRQGPDGGSHSGSEAAIRQLLAPPLVGVDGLVSEVGQCVDDT